MWPRLPSLLLRALVAMYSTGILSSSHKFAPRRFGGVTSRWCSPDLSTIQVVAWGPDFALRALFLEVMEKLRTSLITDSPAQISNCCCHQQVGSWKNYCSQGWSYHIPNIHVTAAHPSAEVWVLLEHGPCWHCKRNWGVESWLWTQLQTQTLFNV